MNFIPILFILILAFSNCSSISHQADSSPKLEPEFLYQFTPYFNNGRLMLQVDLEFQGNSQGEDKIILPSTWGGQSSLYHAIKNLVAVSPQTEIIDSTNPHLKTVRYLSDLKVHLRYNLVQDFGGKLRHNRQYYRPILTPSYFHLIGETFLIYPDRDSDKPAKVVLRWKDVPSHWQIINSFGKDKGIQRLHIPLNQLKYAIFLGGDFRIHKRSVKGRPLYLALRGTWGFSDAEFSDLVAQALKTERGFWQDHRFPSYLVSLIPTEGPCCHYAGTSLTDSVALFLTENQKITPLFKHLVTHELFHTWNGRIIQRQKPEELVFWFSEGFTNYYTQLLNLRSGLISLKEYVASYNKVLRDYYTSPARLASNLKIVGQFWSNKSSSRLPYLKGEILAHNWDEMIRKKKAGKTLDDFMRDFLKAAKKSNTVVSKDSIDRLIRNYIPGGVRHEIDRYVDQGALIKNLAKNMGPCIKLNQIILKSKNQMTEHHWGAATKYQKMPSNTIVIPQYELDENMFGKDSDRCVAYFGL